MKDYDPVESLREEIKRFKSTNTFTPMLVTNFYVQAGLVMEELDRIRLENTKLRNSNSKLREACENICSPLRPHWRTTLELAANAISIDNETKK